MKSDDKSDNTGTWDRLAREVIEAGLCTHCGTCAGLSSGALSMRDTPEGPLPVPSGRSPAGLDPACYEACPGKGLDYPSLNRSVFGDLPANWLIGNVRKAYVGHASEEPIRRNGASGGIVTRTLIYLLEQGIVDGAIMLQQGTPTPWQASPVIARTREEVLRASQSVYVPAPVNVVLETLAKLEGKFAFVGLPDQVASIRRLQQLSHPAVSKITHILGLYCGTIMHFGAVRSFLRSRGVHDVREIAKLSYREGEWPGKLQIVTVSGKVFEAEKFHYNYLIPFYITRSSLLSVDFASELADISAGDAWHPKYESDRKGYSVVLARSEKGEALLERMRKDQAVTLEEKPLEEVLSMHGHMLDFKKRGAFIRMGWRKRLGRRVPEYGYRPKELPLSRRAVEVVVSGLFAVGRWRLSRRLLEIIPISLLGPAFNALRKSWKNVSKPTKRKGLARYDVILTRH
jgi:coenzyme F420 hydrogenase subunit beta